MSLDDLVNVAQEEILRRYLNREDKRDWAVAWSGGKDSTCVLSLLINSLHEIPVRERTRKVYVIMSDTLVENPIMQNYMHSQVRLLREYVNKWELPLDVNLVHRELVDSYFVLTLGRGYFLPLNNGGVGGVRID